MANKITIKDGTGSATEARVTNRGQLVTSPLDFSDFFNAEANVINTAFNVVPAIIKKCFIITSLDLYANKSVGVADATVELYEADSDNTTIPFKEVYKREMLKQSSVTIAPLNILLAENKWLNIKTDDNTVFVNITGYYVDA